MIFSANPFLISEKFNDLRKSGKWLVILIWKIFKLMFKLGKILINKISFWKVLEAVKID